MKTKSKSIKWLKASDDFYKKGKTYGGKKFLKRFLIHISTPKFEKEKDVIIKAINKEDAERKIKLPKNWGIDYVNELKSPSKCCLY